MKFNESLDSFETESSFTCNKIAYKLTPSLVKQHDEHFIATLQGLAYVQELPKFYDNDYQSRKVTLPLTEHKKLAIFDMDETLIHCLGSKKYEDKRRRMNDRGVEL